MNEHLSTAVQLTPVLERVHGASHPELSRVNELTQRLSQIAESGETEELFRELRRVTNNYEIPGDACEAYQAAYQALQAADQQLADS